MKVNYYFIMLIFAAILIQLSMAETDNTDKRKENEKIFEQSLNCLSDSQKISAKQFDDLLMNIPALPESRKSENYKDLANQISRQSTFFDPIVGLWTKYPALRNSNENGLLVNVISCWISQVEKLKLSKTELPISTLNVPPPWGPGAAGQDYHTAKNPVQRAAWGAAVKQNHINEQIREQTFNIDKSLDHVRFMERFVQEVIDNDTKQEEAAKKRPVPHIYPSEG